MRDLQIAFVGCGGFASTYLGVYKHLDRVNVAVCVDSDEEVASRSAELFGRNGGAFATSDFSSALSDDVDVVVISTPNHLHREQAVAAIAAEKHILLQKPVAATLADAKLISEAARSAQNGVTTGLYLSYFDQPLIHDLKAMVQQGWFGAVTHLTGRLMHRGGLEWSRQVLAGNANWRGNIEETGGGCFIQLAVHYIHVFEWLLEEKTRRVTAFSKNLQCGGLEGEDILVAILEFDSGALATLETGWNSAGELLSVHGTNGSLEYLNNRFLIMQSLAGDFHGKTLTYISEAGNDTHLTSGALQTAEILPLRLDDASNEFNQHRLFLEAVRYGREPFVSIDSGVRDMQIVAAAYESARTGKAVEVESER